MNSEELQLKAHLLRRAGFGVSRSELESLEAKTYEEIVEDLLNVELLDEPNEDYLKRYNPDLTYHDGIGVWGGRWIWRMINSPRVLEEKMALMWHQIFATAWYKSDHTPSSIEQIELFRKHGLSNVKEILVRLSKDPAMLYWLDNCENHADQPNENWGRELLELFSMGVGNYSEDDIKHASRAFTGWTFEQPNPLYPYGHWETSFVFDDDDHDYGEKTFLGETGCFDGEDIIDIICKQDASARFICRHIYNFFVEDEPQVPAWDIEPPRNPEALNEMISIYMETEGDIKSILRFVFNSEFFKSARYKKVKNPAELIAGLMKISGRHSVIPEAGESVTALWGAASAMGQALMNPPTVEGWHTGYEWIDGGALNERVNFAVNQFNDLNSPGFKAIMANLGGTLKAKDILDECLESLGCIDVQKSTRETLAKYAESCGDLRFDESQNEGGDELKLSRMIQLIVATREYQFA